MKMIKNMFRKFYSYWDGWGWKPVKRKKDVPNWYPVGALIQKHSGSFKDAVNDFIFHNNLDIHSKPTHELKRKRKIDLQSNKRVY